MKRVLISPILRKSAWVLVFSLFSSFPSGAAVAKKKRLAASIHRVAARSTPSPLGTIRGGPWTAPTYANSTSGDNADGEDLNVRRAAVEALGPFNGSVVVVDPSDGRILSMVNQKMALGRGFQPCSTIKVSVALAALGEKLIEPQSRVPLNGRRMDLTHALAHSNNCFFATLGEKLGFEKVSYYAHQFGYGEKAGLGIAGEEPGHFPLAPPSNGGVGMLASFGEEILQTPLQLAALMSAIANGGTLYFLRYPRTAEEIANFSPRIKRQLYIQPLVSGITPGLREAVESGTAHPARQDEAISGKTGTCSADHTHLGWFGSFNDAGSRKLVVVVLLTGGRPAIGAHAAEIAGNIYRHLDHDSYFATTPQIAPTPTQPNLILRSDGGRTRASGRR
jgi:penicillin-binding protein 2